MNNYKIEFTNELSDEIEEKMRQDLHMKAVMV